MWSTLDLIAAAVRSNIFFSSATETQHMEPFGEFLVGCAEREIAYLISCQEQATLFVLNVVNVNLHCCSRLSRIKPRRRRHPLWTAEPHGSSSSVGVPHQLCWRHIGTSKLVSISLEGASSVALTVIDDLVTR